MAGQTTASTMRRTCWWMVEHWPCWCMRESSMKDMLVAGQTTVRVFRRTCCWLAGQRPVLSEGCVGGCRRGDDKRLTTEGVPALRCQEYEDCWKQWYLERARDKYWRGRCETAPRGAKSARTVGSKSCLKRARDKYCRGRCETAPRGAMGAKSAMTVGSKWCLKRAKDEYFFRGRCETAPRGAKNSRTVGSKRGGATRSAGSRENETPR